MKTCNVCNGRGQTKATRTEFHFTPYNKPNGKVGEKYNTDKQGSGCPKCLGTGRIE